MSSEEGTDITLHHLNNSRSFRILWLFEELGIGYNLIRYQRKPDMMAPEELKRIHPLGKSPVITDDGNTIAESGAIIDYVLEKYGNGRLKPPKNSEAYQKYNFYMHYAEGSLMPPLLVSLIAQKIEHANVPFFIKPISRRIANKIKETYIKPQMNTHLDFLEDELSKSTWFTGEEFTAADIQMSFPLLAAKSRYGLGDRPNLRSFIERIESREAFQRAIEEGGPLEFN